MIGDHDHGQGLDGQLRQAVLEQLLEVLDVAGHAAHDDAGLLLGEEAERQALEVGEDLDPQVVHDPGGQPPGDLDREALGDGGDGDEHHVGDGHGHDDAEVEVPRPRDAAHAVVDGVLGELGSDLAGDRDDDDQQSGEDQHPRVLGEEAPQGEALQLVLVGVLLEREGRRLVLGLRGHEAVDPGLELRRGCRRRGVRRAAGRPDGTGPAAQSASASEPSAPGHRPTSGPHGVEHGSERGVARRPSAVVLRPVVLVGGLELGGLGQHLGVERGGGQELGVGAVGHHLVLVEQDHPVGQRDGRQPVGDDQGGPALHRTFRPAWMVCSTWTSMALVASSSTRIGGLTSRVRAMAMRWRWPPDSV